MCFFTICSNFAPLTDSARKHWFLYPSRLKQFLRQHPLEWAADFAGNVSKRGKRYSVSSSLETMTHKGSMSGSSGISNSDRKRRSGASGFREGCLRRDIKANQGGRSSSKKGPSIGFITAFTSSHLLFPFSPCCSQCQCV